MEVVFEGRFSEEEGISEVLQDIRALKNNEVGILRISSPSQSVNGRVILYKGQYVIGGVLTETGETGYAAVRKLLSVEDGNFAYIDLEGEKPEEECESVCMDVQALLDLGRPLPETFPGMVVAEGVQPFKKIDPKIEQAAERIREATQTPSAKSTPEVAALRKKGKGFNWVAIAVTLLVVGGTAYGCHKIGPGVMAALNNADKQFFNLLGIGKHEEAKHQAAPVQHKKQRHHR